MVYGTAGNDKLIGTAGNDVICGLGGNDQIDGRAGNDILDGGPGNDTIAGGDGDDQLAGEDGNDTLDGGIGNDGVYGGAGDDVITGADGNDGLVGGAGSDKLTGANGNDSLAGGDGNDLLYGSAGDDVLDGGDNVDTLDAASGTDVCRNGETNLNCEQGAAAFNALATPFPVTAPVAGPQTITVDDTFPGVSLTIDTDGGIYPWQVHIAAARDHTAGRVAQLLAGPAFDITVPKSAPPIRSGHLTLPYSDTNLGGAAETDLRIWTFDETTQFWIPVPGAQVVDPINNTVTAPVSHFSVYAVLKVRTPDEWRAIFGQTPLRCTGGTAARLDVVFLIDMSGSMLDNDPTNQRVAGAKAFVDAMRQQDRAAVVGFDSVVYPQIGLTALDNQANVDAVKAAIDRTGQALDGTDISVAVRRAIDILNANGGGGRLRVAVLLTDGQSPYDTRLTTEAANDAIEIHTVGLGAGTDANLLQGIANGTGATYRHLDDPSQLPDLYRQLAGDIIGGGTDTDHDGLSDCIERNGMFVPVSISFPFVGTIFEGASFITTDPNNPDTDGDGLTDGQEVVAHDLLSDTALRTTYDFLVQDGLTTYYTLVADPTKKDTDGDGYDDKYELDRGMNPFLRDANELGIDGLDLPAFTLFQPDRYTKKPALAEKLQLTSTPAGNVVEEILYNSNPVRYDGDRNCVETCDAIRTLAQERPNDNGWGICIFGHGDCVTDESQMRDIVEEARVKQGVFDKDGNLDQRFLQEQTALECSVWYADAKRCADQASQLHFSDQNPDNFLALLAVGTGAIDAPGEANPEQVRRLAEILAKTAAVIAAGYTIEQIKDTVKNCIEGPVLKVIRTLAAPFVHPCEAQPTYAPGGDVRTASEHRVAAIVEQPSRAVEAYASQAERAARPFGRAWYRGKPGCTATDIADAQSFYGVPVSCDEFPNWAMDAAGPGASLKEIPASDNSGEGRKLNLFYLACPEVTREVRADRALFIVAPVPVAPATVWHCGG